MISKSSPSTPKGLAILAGFILVLVGQFALTAGLFWNSASSSVSRMAPVLLVGAILYAAIGLFLLYAAARRISAPKEVHA